MGASTCDVCLLPSLVWTTAGAMLFVMDISFGAIVLLIFIIPTSVIMHNFWDAPDLKVQMWRYWERVGSTCWEHLLGSRGHHAFRYCTFGEYGLASLAWHESLMPSTQVYNVEMIQFLKASAVCCCGMALFTPEGGTALLDARVGHFPQTRFPPLAPLRMCRWSVRC